MEYARCRDYIVFNQVHEAVARMTNYYSALLRGILPPLLNRYARHNNIYIWRVGQPSHRAVYSTYMQISTIIRCTIWTNEAPKPDTKTPKNQQVE